MDRLARHMFKIDSPLGPSTTPAELIDVSNKRTFLDFYDDENFLSQEVLTHYPCTVLGRRGSGKTAILYHIRFRGGYDIVVNLESNRYFTQVAEEIETRLGGAGSAGASFAENSARIWRTLIYTAIICQTYDKFKNDSRIKDAPELAHMLSFMRAHEIVNLRLYHRIWRKITRFFDGYTKAKYNVPEDFDFFTDFIDGYFREEGGFDEAYAATKALLEQFNVRALVLIDSLEQFPIHRTDMRIALSGLLHFVGETDRELNPVNICFCFPAELHEDLIEISSNPEKDFERVVTLHWDASELFQLCAHRLDYGRQQHPDLYGWDAEPLGTHPSRQEIWKYWNQFLPKKIINRKGFEEETVAYISRHTQLLPRHIIELINRILMLGLKRNGGRDQITNHEVTEGVRLAEAIVCRGVIDGFKQKYPTAREVLKLLVPNIANNFSFKELHEVNRDKGLGIESDPIVVLDMLIRMGVAGKFEFETDRYRHYRFDYTYNGELPYSTDDEFGLHPAFSGQFRSLGRMEKPVYPIEEFTGQRQGVGRLE